MLPYMANKQPPLHCSLQLSQPQLTWMVWISPPLKESIKGGLLLTTKYKVKPYHKSSNVNIDIIISEITFLLQESVW